MKKKIRLALDRRTVRSLESHEVAAAAAGMTSDTYPPRWTHEFSECKPCPVSFQDLC